MGTHEACIPMQKVSSLNHAVRLTTDTMDWNDSLFEKSVAKTDASDAFWQWPFPRLTPSHTCLAGAAKSDTFRRPLNGHNMDHKRRSLRHKFSPNLVACYVGKDE
jgi:hypothetical protein